MPLPSNPKQEWPPVQVQNILPAMARWSAWWANDVERLQAVYGGGTVADQTGFFLSDQGGRKVHSLGPIRWFVGEPPTGATRNTKMPIPIAAELCQASADLLFSDPVQITVDDEATMDRLSEILDDAFHSTTAEGAESAAALGGAFLRATWDDSIADKPFTTIVDADMAIPEFLLGRLRAVTFWWVVAREGKVVWRHLERHELAPNGNGVILHALYSGADDVIGTRMPLSSRAETAQLEVWTDLNLPGTIDTGSKGLAVEYVSNQTPNRMWRHDSVGRYLGRSDLDGVEHLMDQLAETMTDWMRARRAARARIMMAKSLTQTGGPGQGDAVAMDQEIYTSLNMLGKADQSLADQVQVLQPAFEFLQYKETATSLIEQILQMAGYSMQTFGVNPEGASERTATEIESKERRSLMTRGRKIREWSPALRAHVTKLLELDNTFFGGHNRVDGLEVEFSDGVQESQIKLGQFVQSLFASESASTKERVSILHPDWDEDQVDAEVAAIKDEFATQPDPMMPPDFGPTDGTAAA